MRNLTNGSGQNTGAYNYKPFGEPLLTSGSSTNPFQYAGQLSDSYIKLYYLRARYYQPETGRFITRDPFSGYPSQPQSLNAYSYGWNNPIGRADPTGYDWWDDAKKAARSFLQGFADQYTSDEALGLWHRAGFGEDQSEAYWLGRQVGRRASTLSSAAETAFGILLIDVGSGGECLGAVLSATGVGTGPGVIVIVVSGGVIVIGGAAAGHGIVVLGRNALDNMAFSRAGSGVGGSLTPDELFEEMDRHPGRFVNSDRGKGRAMDELQLTDDEFNVGIHDLKKVEGNPDVIIDLETGNVYDPRSGEHLGNLLDYQGMGGRGRPRGRR